MTPETPTSNQASRERRMYRAAKWLAVAGTAVCGIKLGIDIKANRNAIPELYALSLSVTGVIAAALLEYSVVEFEPSQNSELSSTAEPETEFAERIPQIDGY